MDNRAAVSAVCADGIDHLVVIVIADGPDDFYLPAVQFIGHDELEFPRVFLEGFFGPEQREGDAVPLFLEEPEVRDTSEAVARQLVFLSVHAVFVVLELADNREEYRRAVFPPRGVAVPEVFRFIGAFLDGTQFCAMVADLYAEFVILNRVKHVCFSSFVAPCAGGINDAVCLIFLGFHLTICLPPM